MTIYLACQVQMALLNIKKAFVTVLTKYLDFVNVFLQEFIIIPLEYININNHAIDLKKENCHSTNLFII